MHNFLVVSAILNVVASIIAGSVVYFKHRENIVHKTFAALCLFIVVWALGSFFSLVAADRALALFAFQVMHVGLIFIAPTNFHFVCAILDIIPTKRSLIRAGYLASALMALLVLIYQPSFLHWTDPGLLYYMGAVIWVGYFAYSTYLLNAKYITEANGEKKYRLKYLSLGNIAMFGVFAVNLLPVYGIAAVPYFNIFIAGQISAFAYSVVHYRFPLDVQLNLLNIGKKVAALIFAIVLGFWISYFIFFRKEELSLLLLFPAISLTLYFSFSSFFNSQHFYKLLHLKHMADFEKAIAIFYEKRFIYKSLPGLQDAIKKIFIAELKIRSAKLILLNTENKNTYKDLNEYFNKNPSGCLVLRESYLRQKVISQLSKNGGGLCFPLWEQSGQLIGFFVLGDKSPNIPYSTQEKEILKSVAVHFSLLLKVFRYNHDLRRDVVVKTKELETTCRKLKTLDKAKDTFFAITAHDLRTPLTIIKGYSDFLLSNKFGKLSTKQKDFESRIFNTTNELLQLVNNILDISKLEANRMEFNFSEVNIQNILANVIADFQIKCQEKNITLRLANPDDLNLSLRTDPEQLKRVLVNLLGNAYKFTLEEGTIIVTIQKGEKYPRMLEIVVADNGIGISRKDQKMIFEKYNQAKNLFQKKYNSTGLGLSIVKKIVTKLGGHVWLKSTQHKGSVFTFALPIKNSKT